MASARAHGSASTCRCLRRQGGAGGRGGSPVVYHTKLKCHYGILFFVTEVVTVDRAGRVVIPKAIRDAAGIDERTKLLIAVTEHGRLVLQKLEVEDLATRLKQELAGKDVDAIVRKVREETNARIRRAYPDLSA